MLDSGSFATTNFRGTWWAPGEATASTCDETSEAKLSPWTLLLGHVLAFAASGEAEPLTASSRAVSVDSAQICGSQCTAEATVAHFTRPVLTSWQLPNRSACAVQGAGLASRETPHAPVGDGAGGQVKGADEAHRFYQSYLRRTAPAHYQTGFRNCDCR